MKSHHATILKHSTKRGMKGIDGGLAQLGEHLPYKQRVSGSSPLTSTIFFADLAQLAEQLICNQ